VTSPNTSPRDLRVPLRGMTLRAARPVASASVLIRHRRRRFGSNHFALLLIPQEHPAAVLGPVEFQSARYASSGRSPPSITLASSGSSNSILPVWTGHASPATPQRSRGGRLRRPRPASRRNPPAKALNGTPRRMSTCPSVRRPPSARWSPHPSLHTWRRRRRIRLVGIARLDRRRPGVEVDTDSPVLELARPDTWRG
jgi:hypothetical protein